MTVFRQLVQFSIDGSIHYQFIDWRSSFELMAAGRAQYTELKNMLVWDQGHGSRGFYRSQHELIYCYKRGKAPHICTFAIEKGARVRTNVLKYPGCNSFGLARKSNLAAHVTTKNFSLIADLIRDCSEPGGIILDPFGGSGQTLLASQWTGRRARLIEIEPRYVDVTIRRWEEQTGCEALLQATGQTFAEIVVERGGDLFGEEGELDG